MTTRKRARRKSKWHVTPEEVYARVPSKPKIPSMGECLSAAMKGQITRTGDDYYFAGNKVSLSTMFGKRVRTAYRRNLEQLRIMREGTPWVRTVLERSRKRIMGGIY